MGYMNYEERLEVAKRLYELSNAEQKTALECIFPELCESEDERIRKELIEHIVKEVGLYPGEDRKEHKWLRWLEKQGEQKLPIEMLPEEVKTIGESLGFTTQEECDEYNQMVSNLIMSDDNKDKTKFKVGDWVVRKDGKPFFNGNHYAQITVIDKEQYWFDSGTWLETKDIRLWTIQDAKNGDILQSSNKPFIYNEYLEEGKYPFGYGGINLYGRFGVSNGLLPMTHDEVTPATKEQRDLLFQKMKEAGYAFDFEKKELKKIDNEEVNGEDYGIDGIWHAQRILEKTLGSVDGYQSDDGILSHKCAITAVKKLYEQKPTEWCEEDDWMKTKIIKVLLGCETFLTPEETNDCVYFLKSLKERYTWKPSEEQMRALHDLNLTGNISYAGQGQVLINLYNDLKKLKVE